MVEPLKVVNMFSWQEIENRSAILNSSDFFSSFSIEEIRMLAEHSVLREYETGEHIFRINDPGVALFVVQDGEIIIRKQDESRKMIDIARFVRKNCFGEMDLFTSSSRSAEALALKSSRLLMFPGPGKIFRDILAGNPSLSAQILHKFLVLIARRIRTANALIKENSPLVQELKKQVYVDKLTGLYNRTFLEEKIRTMSKQKNCKMALIMFKPDNFKELNDQYGHEAGDKALQIIGKKLTKRIGNAECVIRYMGNEHAILLPGADRNEALDMARSLRHSFNRMKWNQITGEQPFKMTVSFGISVYPEYVDDPLDLIALAHELPLIGRSRGGNKILFPGDKY